MKKDIKLRGYLPEDEEFLYALFISSHPDLQNILGLGGDDVRDLMYHQYCIEKSQMEALYPKEAFNLVIHDTLPIGKFNFYCGLDHYRIISIALLTEFQNLGIGSMPINGLIKKAASEDKKILLQVAWNNVRAKELYYRLGFVLWADREVYQEMIWDPNQYEIKKG